MNDGPPRQTGRLVGNRDDASGAACGRAIVRVQENQAPAEKDQQGEMRAAGRTGLDVNRAFRLDESRWPLKRTTGWSLSSQIHSDCQKFANESFSIFRSASSSVPPPVQRG